MMQHYSIAINDFVFSARGSLISSLVGQVCGRQPRWLLQRQLVEQMARQRSLRGPKSARPPTLVLSTHVATELVLLQV